MREAKDRLSLKLARTSTFGSGSSATGPLEWEFGMLQGNAGSKEMFCSAMNSVKGDFLIRNYGRIADEIKQGIGHSHFFAQICLFGPYLRLAAGPWAAKRKKTCLSFDLQAFCFSDLPFLFLVTVTRYQVATTQ